MSKIADRYRALKSHKIFYLQLVTGVLFMVTSLFFNYYANNYTAFNPNTRVSDLIIDHLPEQNVEFIFLEGFMIFIASVVLLGFHKPQRMPFILKASALFIGIRAFFITLTHLAPPLHSVVFHPNGLLERVLTGSGDDLFFSGHTGFPFLMALIFWENKYLRVFFLAASLLFGIAVLLGHLHYSIDVFSAFFISYGIYHIALKFFKKDYELFNKTP